MKTKKFYIVMAITTPTISVNGKDIKPSLHDDIAGYAPIYKTKREAKKDWPRMKIKTLEYAR